MEKAVWSIKYKEWRMQKGVRNLGVIMQKGVWRMEMENGVWRMNYR